MSELLTKKESFQESKFDEKAGKKKIYAIGGRDNRNHNIKIRSILRMLDLKKGGKVLEVGVGEGEHAYRCLQDTDASYTGIDISEKTLAVARERIRSFHGRYTLKKDNANNLSFEDGLFDATFCAATLHHMDDPFLMISEMARILKPNGKIVLMEPNWIYPSNIGFALLLKEDRNMWIMRRKNFIKWMKKAGLRNIRVEHLIYTPPVPKSMIPVYDKIDALCAKLPIINRCSLMLFGSAVK